MRVERIIVALGEVQTRRRVRELLARELPEYEVLEATPGQELYQAGLSTEHVALVLISASAGAEMGDVEALTKSDRTSSLPYLGVTPDDATRTQEPLRGLKNAEFVTRPDEARLLASVRSALDRFAPLRSEFPYASPDERPYLLFLEYLLQRDDSTVRPQIDVDASRGFAYPVVDTFVEKTGRRVEDPFAFLRHLADVRCLDRILVNKLHLCPFCDTYNLIYKEVCPNCRNLKIELVEMVHHFRCAHVGPATEFESGLDYVCPKCRHKLRHIGIDYEKPTESFHCVNCNYVFSDPDVECESLTCGRSFPVKDAKLQMIYSYEATRLAREALENGTIYGIQLDVVLQDSKFGVFRSEYFIKQLAGQMARFARYKEVSCLAAVKFLMDKKPLSEKYPDGFMNYWRLLCQVIKEDIRPSDIPGMIGTNTIGILLPQTDRKQAQMLIERLRKKTGTVLLGGVAGRFEIVTAVADVDTQFPTANELVEHMLAELGEKESLRAQIVSEE